VWQTHWAGRCQPFFPVTSHSGNVIVTSPTAFKLQAITTWSELRLNPNRALIMLAPASDCRLYTANPRVAVVHVSRLSSIICAEPWIEGSRFFVRKMFVSPCLNGLSPRKTFSYLWSGRYFTRISTIRKNFGFSRGNFIRIVCA